MNQEINLSEIRDCFNKIISIESDPNKIATLELLREYYTNPEFKNFLEETTFQMNYLNPSYN